MAWHIRGFNVRWTLESADAGQQLRGLATMTELNIGRPSRPPVQRSRMTTGRYARLFFKDNIARFTW